MGTAAAMLAEARRWLGTSGRPNTLTRAYATRNKDDGMLRAPWCDIAVTEWAHRSGNAAVVLPAGKDRAYTVWHADDFRKAKRWYEGTTANVAKCRPGDIVFFDWGGSNSLEGIDHVGIVEVVLGDGRVQTIEGNTSDSCRRRVRSASSIAGYGRPAYSGKTSQPKPPTSKAPKFPGRLLTQPPVMRGSDVKTWQAQMRERGWELAADGVYGSDSEQVCRAFQKEKGLGVDGVVGSRTWAATWTAPVT